MIGHTQVNDEKVLCVRQFNDLPGSTMGSQIIYETNPLPYMLFILGFSIFIKIPSVINAFRPFLHLSAIVNLNDCSKALAFSLA